MNTKSLDFWVGNFNSENDFYEFVEEDENYYKKEESEEKYISKFAKYQGTIWLDYDFVECGFEDSSGTIYEKFSEYSFAEQWLPILVNRLNETNLKLEINSLIFIDKGEIPNPVSVEDDLFSLVYIGRIDFNV